MLVDTLDQSDSDTIPVFPTVKMRLCEPVSRMCAMHMAILLCIDDKWMYESADRSVVHVLHVTWYAYTYVPSDPSHLSHGHTVQPVQIARCKDRPAFRFVCCCY